MQAICGEGSGAGFPSGEAAHPEGSWEDGPGGGLKQEHIAAMAQLGLAGQAPLLQDSLSFPQFLGLSRVSVFPVGSWLRAVADARVREGCHKTSSRLNCCRAPDLEGGLQGP